MKKSKTGIKGRGKWWKNLTPLQRRKLMPSRRTGAFKRKLGSYFMLDVGRPKHHYIFVQKIKYGWRKAKPPKRLLRAGWKVDKRGLVHKEK